LSAESDKRRYANIKTPPEALKAREQFKRERRRQRRLAAQSDYRKTTSHFPSHKESGKEGE